MTAYSEDIMDGVICWLLFGIAAAIIIVICAI